MKKFGLIGGISWRSTIAYYAMINKLINDEHADNTNPSLRIASLNQREIHDLQRCDDWHAITEIFITACLELQDNGVAGIAICANTPHKVFEQLNNAVSVPILHIADAIGSTLKERGFNTVGLIGTQFTMSEEFLTGRLRNRHQVTSIVPSAPVQTEIQSRIYNELSVGVFDAETRKYFLQLIDSLSASGAQAVVLGCTEFPLLLDGGHCDIPLINSLECHCEAIVRYIRNEATPE